MLITKTAANVMPCHVPTSNWCLGIKTPFQGISIFDSWIQVGNEDQNIIAKKHFLYITLLFMDGSIFVCMTSERWQKWKISISENDEILLHFCKIISFSVEGICALNHCKCENGRTNCITFFVKFTNLCNVGTQYQFCFSLQHLPKCRIWCSIDNR